MGEGPSKFALYIINIVFVQVAKNEYIRYSYSVRLGGTNIFDIHIRSGTYKQIYLMATMGFQNLRWSLNFETESEIDIF